MLYAEVIEKGITGEVGAPAMAVLAVCGEDGHGAMIASVRGRIKLGLMILGSKDMI